MNDHDTHPALDRGTRLHLAPEHTGLDQDAWAVVEQVEYVANPSQFPWNAGPAFPWRVGYRITVIHDSGDVLEPLGIIWVDENARDPRGALVRIEPA